MSAEINRDIAVKVLSVVDAGLVSGVGNPVPGQMCVEAAVCYALGLPHGDDPACVSRALRSLKIRLNDSNWSSNEARAKGLRRLALAQLGSRDALNDQDFAARVAELAIRKCVPAALRSAASIQKDPKHKAALLAAAIKCEKDGTEKSAREAREIAYAAANAANAANADAYAASAAANAADAYAAAYAAASAAANAANAANAAANAANAAAYAADAYAAAYAAASAAANAADAYADAAYAADAYAAAYAADAYAADAYADARDKSLADFAEGVVQILIEMKAPGCEWLELTEAA